jgi:multiple sugar transport system substrate-binding protein
MSTTSENKALTRPVDRRSIIKGVSAAALVGITMRPQAGAAQDYEAMCASAAIDWKQASGQTITVAGATHPWSSAIAPLLPQFTRLTGIKVLTDFQAEPKFLGALPIKLARRDATPDVFMFYTYGLGISSGWLEPLNGHFSDKSLADLAWYDESDLLETAYNYPLWSDGNRYAFAITSEAMTLFVNNNALAAKNLPIPRTFDELLATAKALKSKDMAGIALRGKAHGGASAAAMGFVFSYGGTMVKDNRAAFDSPEAIAAIEMYGQLLSDAGPARARTYDWYEVLTDFIQGKAAMAIDSSNFATDISNPTKSRVVEQAAFGAFPQAGDRTAIPYASHWQACINARSENKKAAFLFLLWATSKPTSLQTAAAGLATTRLSAWSSDGFKRAFGEQAAEAALANLKKGRVDLTKAIVFHPQSSAILDAFMIGVNQVVTGKNTAHDAMTAAAKKANAAVRA